jgi:hypothetical protein
VSREISSNFCRNSSQDSRKDTADRRLRGVYLILNAFMTFRIIGLKYFRMLDFCHKPRCSDAPTPLIWGLFVHYIKPGDSEPGLVGGSRAEPGVTSPVFSSLPNIRALTLL